MFTKVHSPHIVNGFSRATSLCVSTPPDPTTLTPTAYVLDATCADYDEVI